VVILIDGEFEKRLRVDSDPRFCPDLAHDYFDLTEWRLDRGGAVLVGDSDRAASDIPAANDRNSPAATRLTISISHEDREHSRQEDIIQQG
jgi:hypothetical protein